MSDSKHTPGPWILNDRPGAGLEISAIVANVPDPIGLFRGPKTSDIQCSLNAEGQLFLMIAYEEWIQFEKSASKIIGRDYHKMQKANAHLISAAPELLAALKDSLAELQRLADQPVGRYDDPFFENARNKADAAIAKAEGEDHEVDC